MRQIRINDGRGVKARSASSSACRHFDMVASAKGAVDDCLLEIQVRGVSKRLVTLGPTISNDRQQSPDQRASEVVRRPVTHYSNSFATAQYEFQTMTRAEMIYSCSLCCLVGTICP
jgi:hypothetical protein